MRFRTCRITGIENRILWLGQTWIQVIVHRGSDSKVYNATGPGAHRLLRRYSQLIYAYTRKYKI